MGEQNWREISEVEAVLYHEAPSVNSSTAQFRYDYMLNVWPH